MNVGMRRAVYADLGVMDKTWTEGEQSNTVSRMSGWLAAPEVFTYLLEETAPFGVVTVGPGEGALTGEILEWCILPGWQHRGYGRKLLVHGIGVLRRRMAVSAEIWVREDADRATQILTKSGFKRAGSEKILNTPGGPEISRLYARNIENFF